MTKKRVILYATKFMNIYQDILKCLEGMNYEVIWIEANTIPNNPFNKTLGFYNQSNIDTYMTKASEKWISLLASKELENQIDYFLSVDGMDIPPMAFLELDNRYQNLKKVLYLYDRVDEVYQINQYFKYYDDIFSFDRHDCEKYSLKFMPIYWVPTSSPSKQIQYDIFAFASYSELKQDRTKIFSDLIDLSKNKGYRSYIKLYDKSYGDNKYLFVLKNLLKYILRKNNLSLKNIFNGLITGNSVSPSSYRDLIDSSRIIFDTQASYQDGLTARFMWAAGIGKKIITTNTNIINYDFYNDNQFLIYNDNITDIDHFIATPFQIEKEQFKKIEPYRIDNWVNSLLGTKQQLK